MSKKLRELQARKATQVATMRAINDKASVENREPTDEEVKQFDAAKAEIGKIEAAITREQDLINFEAQIGVPVREGAIITVSDNLAADPKLGFKSFGEYAMSVKNAGIKGNSQLDQRFAAAPSLFSGEGTGADGGFLVPPEYAKDIFALSLETDNLLPLTDSLEIGSNSMVLPKDETTPWGTDGVRAYWQNEAGAATGTKLKLGTASLRMNKLIALTPVSDELLEDTTALGNYLPSKMADSIKWKSNESFMFGTGAGQPSGALNSAAVVTVAKESGQATGTLLIQNIAKMIARLPTGESYSRAVWMMNNDVLPALFTLVLGNYPIYIPASEGAKVNPYGTLMGRPIMITQHAKSFSSQADVMLMDWKYYRTITKAGGISMAQSLHLYFDADAAAFRAIFRIDGQSKIAAAITPANGSNTLSPYVQLGAR